MEAAWFFFNFALVLTFAVFIVSQAGLLSKPAFLVGIFILAYADVVFILELASLFSAVRANVVFGIQILLTLSGFLAWRRAGRPHLLGPLTSIKIGSQILPGLVSAIRQDPLLTILFGSILYIYALNAKNIIVFHPSNADSLIYHLSRVGYWLQNQSLYPWPTLNLKQTIFPANAELGLLWTILWRGTDQFTGFVQWVTVPIIMLGIYGIARRMGYARRQGLYSAALWATLIQVLFQSQTTQNDLVTSVFWVSALLLFLEGSQHLQYRWPLALSAIAFGLALGTKTTSLIALPCLFFAFSPFIWKSMQVAEFRARMYFWLASSLFSILMLGSYIYIQNTVAYRDPIGPPGMREFALGTPGVDIDRLGTGLMLLRDNSGRYVHQLLDISSLPVGAVSILRPVKAAALSAVYDMAGIRVENRASIGRGSFSQNYLNPFNEDNSWYGPLSIFFLLALIANLFLGVRQRDYFRFGLALFPIGFLLLFSAMELWTPAKGRYFLIPVSVSFPLMAGLVNDRLGWQKVLRAGLALLGLGTLLFFYSHNPIYQQAKQLSISLVRTAPPAWANDPNYRMVLENIPPTANIGLVETFNDPGYIFFDEYFQRKVNILPATYSIRLPQHDYAQLLNEFRASQYIYVSALSVPPNEELFEGFTLLIKNNTQSLWIRNDLQEHESCAETSWPFSEIYMDSSEALCPQFPIYMNASSQLQNGRQTLGVSPEASGVLEFGFAVQREMDLSLTVQVNPAKIKQRQTLQLTILQAGLARQTYAENFFGLKTLTFELHLLPGEYTLRFGLQEGSVSAQILSVTTTVR